MNNIKTKFSIKDLENLSGIKAHTIRIWEKRYDLFEPNRTETNIRYYSLESLQKLLNISFLNKNGYKVSKIAKLAENEVPTLVKNLAESRNTENRYVDILKISMLNFDQSLFNKTFLELEKKYVFDDIFFNVFIPLLDTIGMLWQTSTITPAHEHFIVELIKQKLLIATDQAQNDCSIKSKERVFVLFLPENEMHELGLLYMNYRLALEGYYKIYLGQSVPIESLEYICDIYDQITFISVFTIKPDKDSLSIYFKKFSDKLLKKTKNNLLVTSRFTDIYNVDSKISVHNNTLDLVESNFSLNKEKVKL